MQARPSTSDSCWIFSARGLKTFAAPPQVRSPSIYKSTWSTSLKRRTFPEKTPSEADAWQWLHCKLTVASKKSVSSFDLISPDFAGEAIATEISRPGLYPAVEHVVTQSSGIMILCDSLRVRDHGAGEDLFAMKLATYIAERHGLYGEKRGKAWQRDHPWRSCSRSRMLAQKRMKIPPLSRQIIPRGSMIFAVRHLNASSSLRLELRAVPGSSPIPMGSRCAFRFTYNPTAFSNRCGGLWRVRVAAVVYENPTSNLHVLGSQPNQGLSACCEVGRH